ncbi:MAG TPA: TIGR00730 family Rossman fold protein [Saprospiraceae bacterium]|nr:TIGR00730 family Rossman fold protein [Saprospiraceae bacterium]
MKVLKPGFTEYHYLKGPHSILKELSYTLSIAWDLIKGTWTLRKFHQCISIMGSARLPPQHPAYAKTEQLAFLLAGSGFPILTGGGPSIMEAANKGARQAGGISVGCNIVLPFEVKANSFLDRTVCMNYFFTRKTVMIRHSQAMVIFPGGFGTMDEFFDTITLVQTGKLKQFPIVIFDSVYHQHLIALIRQFEKDKAIEPLQQDYFLISDSVEEIHQWLLKRCNIPK